MVNSWIAMYSQTGTELSQIIKEIGRAPDIIMTNNRTSDVSRFSDSIVIVGSHEYLMTLLQIMLQENDMVTLHGYLRIIPGDVLRDDVYFYNGHPGLITEYPELRGKDPQEKVLAHTEKYERIGCVIHEVDSEVDAGNIICSIDRPAGMFTSYPALLYDELHTMSVDLWSIFLKEVFCDDVANA